MDATLVSLAIVLALILCSAFFSGSETALTAASKARMTNLANHGSKRASQVNGLRDQMEKVIGTILLGNAFVNSSIAALTTAALTARLGETAAFYAAGAATIVIFIFGEVLPKTFAINRADRTSLAIAPLILLLVRITYPITHVTQLLCNFILRSFGIRVVKEPGAEERMEELRGAIELHTGAVDEIREHGQMLHSILDLADVPVADIMVHRRNVNMIDADLPAADILAAIVGSPHTRLPLWRGDPDNVIGVLHAKDLLRAVQAAGGKFEGLAIENNVVEWVLGKAKVTDKAAVFDELMGQKS